ncbi:hypothetical protein [Sphingomonas bacterium]|uniref:hypothetical protein n=1 Tax=Sphingomonas bacterium TaxID=1895847 RepID=UPI001C2DBFED|nr:hypothetical protein [Sphingomonas bacterium]
MHAASLKEEKLVQDGGYQVEPALTGEANNAASFVASNGRASVLVATRSTTATGNYTAVVVASSDRAYAMTMRDGLIALLRRR